MSSAFVMSSVRSRPTRVRGLKWQLVDEALDERHVAPHAGAWIEMGGSCRRRRATARRAPMRGVWIEIVTIEQNKQGKWVVPPRGRVD